MLNGKKCCKRPINDVIIENFYRYYNKLSIFTKTLDIAKHPYVPLITESRDRSGPTTVTIRLRIPHIPAVRQLTGENVYIIQCSFFKLSR